jgi:transposase
MISRLYAVLPPTPPIFTMAPRSELTPALRERICELHSAAGWGYKRIQKRYPFISISGVRYTIKRDRERIGGVTKPRTGRPRKLDEADREKLLDTIAKNPKITREDMLAKVSYKVSIILLYAIIYSFLTFYIG